MKLMPNFFLRPSGLNNTFHGGHISFQDYTQHTQSMVAAARTDLIGDKANLVMLANGAYEWRPEKPTQNGVLLIHGLYDSPFTLREIGQYFLQKNFLVRSILLPGHGTVPGDLLNITYAEWIKAVAYGTHNLSHSVTNIYLAGFSLGGTLAIYQALQSPAIKALVLFAPALKPRHYVDLALAWHRMLGHVYQPLKWYQHKKQTSYAKYESYPCNGAYQSIKLMKVTQKLLREKRLTIPTFIAASQDDESISPRAISKFFIKNLNPLSQFLLYTNASKKPANSQIIYKTSAYPEQNILSFSHIAIPFSPLNPHYGIHGDYKDLYSYNNNNNDEDEPLYFGAISNHNVKKYHRLQRLSYNPDFHGMMQQLDGFLNKVI